MAPRYRITLTVEERKELEVIFKTGRRSAKTILHFLLHLMPDSEVLVTSSPKYNPYQYF